MHAFGHVLCVSRDSRDPILVGLCRLEEAHLKLAQAVDLQRTTQLQADQLQAQNDELFRALETAEAARR